MAGLGKDLRGALRLLRRSPGFSFIIIATVAVGVAGVTSVFSVVRGILLTPLSFADSDRVVMLWGRSPDHDQSPLTVGDHNALAENVQAFEAITAQWGNTAPLLGDPEPEQVSVGWVTPSYFPLLGVRPHVGRMLQPGDVDKIVLDHGLWSRRYGSDPEVVGRVLDVGGNSLEVVGILPPEVNPNLTSIGRVRVDYQVWRLQPESWTQGDDRSIGWLRSTAKLREGVTVAQAQAEVDSFMERLNPTVQSRDGGLELRVLVVPVRDDLVGDISRTLWILLAAVGGVLLIAASNVAHLMLARAHVRAGDLAIRAALGGSRQRLLRQMMVESSVLASMGGLLGVGLAWVGVKVLVSWAPSSLPRLDTISIDPAVLAIALAATVSSAFFFGVLPAVRATRTDLASLLGERTGTGNRGQRRLSQGLVVAEVAVSVALLVGTGLLLRSFSGLANVNPGFEPDGVMTFLLSSSNIGTTPEEGRAILDDYLSRIEAVSGVQAAGVTNRIPLGGGVFSGAYKSEQMDASGSDGIEASFRFVTPRYFEVMGTRLVAGRGFRPDDGPDIAIIDEKAAEAAWPGENPLGQKLQTGQLGLNGEWAEIVGVVEPMKHADVATEARETIYYPMLAQAHRQDTRYVAIKVAGQPMSYVARMRDAVRAVDPNATIARTRPMNQLYADSLSPTRFGLMLLSLFGGVALLLASVGLYGVIGFSVGQRTREFGIRIALGAETAGIVGSVLAWGARLVGIGVAVGALASLWIGGMVRSVLYEVEPTDPATFILAMTVMGTVGILGAYLPARRVLRVDPVHALKKE